MQETNNFTNLTRLSSFLLLDMLLLIDMTWNTHLSAKNTERKRKFYTWRPRDRQKKSRKKTQILNDAWPNRVQTYAEGSAHNRSRSLACREHHRRRLQKGNEVHHCIRTSAMTRCKNSAFSGGSSFFTNWAGLFFFCFLSCLFLLCLFRFLFYLLERDCLLCAIRDTWLRACTWMLCWAYIYPLLF